MMNGCWDFCNSGSTIPWMMVTAIILGSLVVILMCTKSSYFSLPESFSIPYTLTSKFPFITKESFTAFPYSIGTNDLRDPSARKYRPVEHYQYTKNNAGELTMCPGGQNVVEQFSYVPTDRPAEQPLNASQYQSWNAAQTAKRLDVIDKSLMPRTSENVTPYNIDVADPVAYSFLVNAPRVIKKDPLAMQADPFRGDIPINIFPDVPLIQKSQYDRSSLRLDGAFTEAINKNYDKLTGKAYFNMPQMMSQGGVVM